MAMLPELSDKESRDLLAYVQGQLPAARRRQLEARMETDEAFRQIAEAYQFTHQGLRELALRRQVDGVLDRLSGEEPSALPDPAEIPPPADQPDAASQPLGRERSRAFRWRVAASVALLLAVTGYYGLRMLGPSEAERAYREFYRPDAPSRGADGLGCPAEMAPAREQYYRQEYRRALAALNGQTDPGAACVRYYRGITLLALDEAAPAAALLDQLRRETKPPLLYRVDWYLGLAYLHDGREAQAIRVLRGIRSNAAHPFGSAAGQLLRRLEE